MGVGSKARFVVREEAQGVTGTPIMPKEKPVNSNPVRSHEPELYQ